MTSTPVDTIDIRGSSVDPDPANDPAYPMRHVAGRQPAVAGASTPPAGSDGMIRRAVFRRRESDWWRRLVRMGADRPGMVQGLARSEASDIPVGSGRRSDLPHHPRGMARKAGILAALLGTGFFMWSRRSKRTTKRWPAPAQPRERRPAAVTAAERAR